MLHRYAVVQLRTQPLRAALTITASGVSGRRGARGRHHAAEVVEQEAQLFESTAVAVAVACGTSERPCDPRREQRRLSPKVSRLCSAHSTV